MTKLAQNQVLLEGRLDEHEERLEQIEAVLGDTGRAVTPDQASQISQGVEAVMRWLSDWYRELNVLQYQTEKGDSIAAAELEQISPVAWQHINFHGRYEFTKAVQPINIEAIVQELVNQSRR